MKYVMLKKTIYIQDDKFTRYIPIIFPSILIHEDVADAIKKMAQLKDGFEIASAGELQIDCNGIKAFGRSISLNVESNPLLDSLIIETIDYGGGFR